MSNGMGRFSWAKMLGKGFKQVGIAAGGMGLVYLAGPDAAGILSGSGPIGPLAAFGVQFAAASLINYIKNRERPS
jgi:hypothetical protein